MGCTSGAIPWWTLTSFLSTSPVIARSCKLLHPSPPSLCSQQDSGLLASNAGCVSVLVASDVPCSCHVGLSTVIPNRPTAIQFDSTVANNEKMKASLLQEFASSTFKLGINNQRRWPVCVPSFRTFCLC